MKIIVISVVAIVVLLGAIVPYVMALIQMEYDKRDYFEAWRDAYYNWIHHGKMPEPDTHTDMYYKDWLVL